MRFTREEIATLQSMITIAQKSISARKHELITFVAGEA
jgi:hypothetical protein